MPAPGHPGIAPTWSSSDKDLVTASLGPSRLWATFGHGIVNEVFWPSTGQPQIRDLGFIVAGPHGWFEVKRVDDYTMRTPSPLVPLPRFIHRGPGYTLELEAVPDSMRDVLLLRYRLRGADCRLYALLAPHLGADVADNVALAGGDALCASGGYAAVALCDERSFSRASAGFVGTSDGWQDFSRHGHMTWTYEHAEHGNVALMAELAEPRGVLALALANSVTGARTLARSSLAEGFTQVRESTARGWREWGDRLRLPTLPGPLAREAALSAVMLKVHEDRTYPGAVVASLSVPWGNEHGDTGGYHLVWARDAVEAGHALLTCGQADDARRMLAYLVATQHADGHWAQNFMPDGTLYWNGVQLDEVGSPILFAAALAEQHELPESETVAPMIRSAAAFLAAHGPVTPQDRWEESRGLNGYTLAVEVAALVAAATFLRDDDRRYARSLADYWNERIEDWLYVTGGELADRAGVTGYYVHVAPPPHEGGVRGEIVLPNHGGDRVPADTLVSLDFLRLARLGIRRADDPALVATLAVADAVLRAETPAGPGWQRYRGDGYGEHVDGTPFDGSGVGRLWPLLCGEVGHYAMQRGNDATPFLATMVAMTGRGGLIPEQVWDAAPIPSRNLHPGRPTGSAMPLVWAHAEFLKLAASRDSGQPAELLASVWKRWKGRRPRAGSWHWTERIPFEALPAGRALLVEHDRPFILHAGTDGWRDGRDLASQPLGLDRHGVRLEPAALRDHTSVEFTRRVGDSWEQRDWAVRLGG